MRELLKQISIKAISLGDFEYSERQFKDKWLGFTGASQVAIANLEKRLDITLPEDYKSFLLLTNGFCATTGIDISFEPINKVDYLKNFEHFKESLSFYDEIGESQEISAQFKNSIIIGGIEEEQSFLLLPPNGNNKWRYWRFANWIPGENEFENLEAHFEEVLEFLDDTIQEKEN